MPSPFPGVDPYLEACGLWPDFHARFITYWCDALADQLPDRYHARIGERVSLIDLTEERTKEILPDVAVLADEPRGRPFRTAAGTATLEPVSIPHLIEAEYREAYIEVIRHEDRQLVAVLELLSPSNKTGRDRIIYLDRRHHLLLQNIHLFELDLLLGGRRLPLGKPLPPGDYYAFVSREESRLNCDVYRWSVRDPLPKLPIPLLAPDADVVLDFAAIFAIAYQRGRYGKEIDYNRLARLPLSQEDQAWAAEIIKAKMG